MILLEITQILLFEVILFGRHPAGVERVCLEYIKHYRNESRAVLFGRFIFSKNCSKELYNWLLKPTSRISLSIIIAKGITSSFITKIPKGSFIVTPGNIFPIKKRIFSNLTLRRHLRPIFMVHDLIPITHPEYCIPGSDRRHSSRIHVVLNYAAGIICNSKSTQDELIAFAQEKNIPMPPSINVLLAPGFKKIIPNKTNYLPSPYFVFLATLDPRKNHYLILNIWRKMIKQFGDKVPRLVIIGQRGLKCGHVTYMLERCKVLNNYVIRLTNCTDLELANYLYNSQALLFPTFCEGYGLPLAEAIAQGIPVISSNLPVFVKLPEISRNTLILWMASNGKR